MNLRDSGLIRVPRRATLTLLTIGALVSACGSAPRHAAPGDPTAVEKAAISSALRTIAADCAARRGGRVVPAAKLLVRMDRRYPTQRFRLETGGEEGTMLAVLLIGRYEVRSCSAAAVEVIDAVLPSRIRDALPSRSSTNTQRSHDDDPIS